MSAQARHALQAEALGARVGIALRAGAGVAERAHVVFAHGITSEQLAGRLAAESDIEYAVPDRRIHRRVGAERSVVSDGTSGHGHERRPVAGQWYLRAPAGDVQSSINVEPAWDLDRRRRDRRGRGDRHRRALRSSRSAARGIRRNLLPGYDMISDRGRTANDGDGRDADPSDPGDWVTQAELDQGRPVLPMRYAAGPSSWHGTQTRGLIGALTNNGIGMASVGRTASQVLPVRVLGKCGGFDSDIHRRHAVGGGHRRAGVPDNPTRRRACST